MDEVPGGDGEDVSARDHAGALPLYRRLRHLNRLERLLRQAPVLLHVPLHHRGRRPPAAGARRDQHRRVASLQTQGVNAHISKRRFARAKMLSSAAGGVSYFDEAVVEEEADDGGAGGGAVAEALGGDGGDDPVELGAVVGVEVERELVADRRRPPLPLPLPFRSITNAASDVHPGLTPFGKSTNTASDEARQD